MAHVSDHLGTLSVCSKSIGRFALLLLLVISSAAHGNVTPPQGYIGFQQSFKDELSGSVNESRLFLVY